MDVLCKLFFFVTSLQFFNSFVSLIGQTIFQFQGQLVALQVAQNDHIIVIHLEKVKNLKKKSHILLFLFKIKSNLIRINTAKSRKNMAKIKINSQKN